MRLPKFTAEAALYKSNRHFASKARATLSGAGLHPQGTLPLPPINWCAVMGSLCNQIVQSGGSDPHAWCTWYYANCMDPTGSGSGSGCPTGCWQDLRGACVCHVGPQQR